MFKKGDSYNTYQYISSNYKYIQFLSQLKHKVSIPILVSRYWINHILPLKLTIDSSTASSRPGLYANWELDNRGVKNGLISNSGSYPGSPFLLLFLLSLRCMNFRITENLSLVIIREKAFVPKGQVFTQ